MTYDEWKPRSPDDDIETVPQQWFVCEACDGSGVEVFGTWEYEPGCGFGHASSDERPCSNCDGAGGFLGEAEGGGPDPDDERDRRRDDALWEQQFDWED